MTRRPAVAGLLLATGLTMASTVVQAAPPREPPPPRIDVQVALLGPGGCGSFADELPPLVVEEVGAAGATTPVTRICVASRGTSLGRATMTVLDAVDREVACSADEAAVDGSCAAGDRGELAASLVQLVDVDPRCSRRPPSSVAWEAPFAGLARTAVVLHETMHPQEVICVALQLRYSPSTFEDQLRAQSDQVTWRYAFHLTSA